MDKGHWTEYGGQKPDFGGLSFQLLSQSCCSHLGLLLKRKNRKVFGFSRKDIGVEDKLVE